MSSAQSLTVPEFQTLPFAWSWRSVLRAAAVAELLLLVATIVGLRDLLAAALAIILLVGLSLYLLRDKMFGFMFEMIARVIMWRIPVERLGALILACLFADIGFYTLTGAASNLLNGASGAAILLPASLGAIALIGFAAAVRCLIRPAASAVPERAGVNFVVGVVVVWSIVMGVGLMSGARMERVLPPSDFSIVTENMGYSKTALNGHAGRVVLQLENHDLFWHTFTINELGVDLKVPVEAKQQIAFDAPPGIYYFHCSIPGHELLGMKGTLTVQ